MRNKPLFIVGMPRSGTKLLRNLLNNHSRISIPTAETLFIPDFINKYGWNPDFSAATIHKFIKDLKNTHFYYYMSGRGYVFDEQDFIKNTDLKSWYAIFQYILKYYAPEQGENIIWGDKSPNYINHIPLIKRIFTDSYIIHIIRDPRDYVLSMKKAWGKNMYLAAANWNRSMIKAKEDGMKAPADCMEIKYENLLENPLSCLKEICGFLNLPFEKEMGNLKAPTENIGDTKEKITIVRNNKAKYIEKMSEKKIRKIESLCYQGMGIMSYQIQLAKEQHVLPFYKNKIYRYMDIINRLIFNIKTHGIINGVKFSLMTFRK